MNTKNISWLSFSIIGLLIWTLFSGCDDANPATGATVPVCDVNQYWANNPDLQTVYGNPLDGIDDATDAANLQNHWATSGYAEGRTCSVLGVSSVINQSSSSQVPAKMNRVAFVPSYHADPRTMRYDRLTHVILFSVLLNSDGSLNTTSYMATPNFQTIKNDAKAAGLSVSVAVGGANGSSNFATVLGNATTRANVVAGLNTFVTQEGLDGVDVDWEFPKEGESGILLSFMQELAAVLHPAGKHLQLDLPTVQHADRVNFDPALVSSVDMFNVMAYDMNFGGLKYHARFSDVQATGDYWVGAGFPANKLNIGIPFYYWNTKLNSYLGWAEYLRKVKYDAEVSTNTIMPTWDEKLQKIQWIANGGFAGTMYWEVGQDTYIDDAYADSSLVLYFDEQLKALGK